MNIKLVLFDLGGVVFKLDWKATYETLNCPLSFEEALSVIGQSKALDDFEKGLISPFQFYEELKSLIQLEMNYESFINAWNKVIEGPVDGIEALLAECKEKFPIMALTNTNIIHYEKLWNILDHNYFDNVFASHLMNKRKPNEDIYLEVLEHTGLLSKEILFIDDTIPNIQTAKDLSFETLLNFNNTQEIRNKIKSYLAL